MENFEQMLFETAERSKSNTHRINELAKEQENIHELAISVREIAINTQTIQRQLTQQGAKIEALERIPVQRWNGLVKAVLATLCTTLLGGVMGAVLTMILK